MMIGQVPCAELAEAREEVAQDDELLLDGGARRGEEQHGHRPPELAQARGVHGHEEAERATPQIEGEAGDADGDDQAHPPSDIAADTGAVEAEGSEARPRRRPQEVADEQHGGRANAIDSSW